MKGSVPLSRRALLGGAACLALTKRRVSAQGFAGLGRDATGFATVVPNHALQFPADHGPHPEFRIEWWYLTANLTDADGSIYGVQWTLFRQATQPGPTGEGWENQQIWMGHAAATSAGIHRASETFARGGVGQAGVESKPFQAWIDAWEMNGDTTTSDHTIAPLQVTARGTGFDYTLRLETNRPLVLQGDNGFSKKSEQGQASYYYSQPWFKASGRLVLDGNVAEVSGTAWMDREWSSQPLASEQTGWDWFSLHLDSDTKLMLFRLRQRDGKNYFSGNWITADGHSAQLAPGDISMTPTAFTEVDERRLPTSWAVVIPSRGLKIDVAPLNPQSWMATSFPYWEGPIRIDGSHRGVGYLEMTGY